MRESRIFGKRTLVFSSDNTLRKYFLIYEGSDTEAIYFKAIDSMRENSRINPLIQLIPILRSYSETGWSNPQKILDRMIENLEECRTNHISYETLLNRIMDYLYENKIISTSRVQARNIWETMSKICINNFVKGLDSDVEDIEKTCGFIAKALQEEYELQHVVSNISNIIEDGEFTYEEGFDKICLIIDRDKGSFVSNSKIDQYEYVVKKCDEKKFGLYVTDPCFEFWLLLHFDEVLQLDRNQLLENPKITAKKRYAEQELCKIWPGYKKSCYNAELLVKNIDRAISNEKEYYEDIQMLKTSVGSNIGLLIEEMRQ